MRKEALPPIKGPHDGPQRLLNMGHNNAQRVACRPIRVPIMGASAHSIWAIIVIWAITAIWAIIGTWRPLVQSVY